MNLKRAVEKALKGRLLTAQGNALGRNVDKVWSPEGAAFIIPGQCPGVGLPGALPRDNKSRPFRAHIFTCNFTQGVALGC